MTEKTLSVYVAGASAELSRARHWITRLQLFPGIYVTFDWTRDIESARRQGKTDADLSESKRFRLAKTDILAVESADVVWGLIPAQAVSTAGLWFELGIAHAKEKRVIVSGNWRRSIFTSLATEKIDVDLIAFQRVISLVSTFRGQGETDGESKNSQSADTGTGSGKKDC